MACAPERCQNNLPALFGHDVNKISNNEPTTITLLIKEITSELEGLKKDVDCAIPESYDP